MMISHLDMNFITIVNGSWLEICTFVLGTNGFSCMWTTLDGKYAFLYLGLTVSHPGCEIFPNCEHLWIGSCIFVLWYDSFTPGNTCCHNCEQVWIGSLHFHGWVWRLHAWGVKCFTGVNDTGQGTFILMYIGLDSSTPRGEYISIYLFVGTNG